MKQKHNLIQRAKKLSSELVAKILLERSLGTNVLDVGTIPNLISQRCLYVDRTRLTVTHVYLLSA